MAAADIYRQYFDDYEKSVKDYTNAAHGYNKSVNYTSGPIRAKSQDGQELGLFSTPQTTRNVVRTGTMDDFAKAAGSGAGMFVEDRDINGIGKGTGSWSVSEGMNGDAIHTMDGSYFSDVGQGYAALRQGGKPSGNFVTERITGTPDQVQQMLESGKYKDVKYVGGEGEDGNGYIDVTYEEMRFPKNPGEFTAEKPNLSLQQIREMNNPTPTQAQMAMAEGDDVGLINRVRAMQKKSELPGEGLINSSKGA